DPARGDSNQNVGRTDFRKCNLRFFQRLPDLFESHRSHFRQRYSGFERTPELKSAMFNESARPTFSHRARLRGNAYELARGASTLLRTKQSRRWLVYLDR